MTAQATIKPKQIQASIRYVKKGESTIFYPAEREKSYWPADDHVMTITDARPLMDQLSVEKNGFAVLKHQTAVQNFYDPQEVQKVFYPEIIELARKINGATKAIAFGPVARSDDPNTNQGRLPSFGAHVDYGRKTVAEQVRLILGDEADYWLAKRVVLMNFWRPIKKVFRSPLALCDASTVLQSDLNMSEIRGGLEDPNRPPLFGYNLSYNPDHKWYYMFHMEPDEVFAFKLYDSDSSRPQWTGHTAIVDPDSSEGDPARESMEIRTISFIDE
jgi:hypothetical protein